MSALSLPYFPFHEWSLLFDISSHEGPEELFLGARVVTSRACPRALLVTYFSFHWCPFSPVTVPYIGSFVGSAVLSSLCTAELSVEGFLSVDFCTYPLSHLFGKLKIGYICFHLFVFVYFLFMRLVCHLML